MRWPVEKSRAAVYRVSGGLAVLGLRLGFRRDESLVLQGCLLGRGFRRTNYLDRGVRTVQRWEHELHLPAHRIGRGKRCPVYAKAEELNFWLITSGVEREGTNHTAANPSLAPVVPDRAKQIENSRRLLQAVQGPCPANSRNQRAATAPSRRSSGPDSEDAGAGEIAFRSRPANS